MESLLVNELASKLRERYPDCQVHTAFGNLYLTNAPHMDVTAVYWVNSARRGEIPWAKAIRFGGMEWHGPTFDVPQPADLKPDVRITIMPGMYEGSLQGWIPYPIVMSYHKVSPGDTLEAIAQAAGITREALWERNAEAIEQAAKRAGYPLTPLGYTNQGALLPHDTVLEMP